MKSCHRQALTRTPARKYNTEGQPEFAGASPRLAFLCCRREGDPDAIVKPNYSDLSYDPDRESISVGATFTARSRQRRVGGYLSRCRWWTMPKRNMTALLWITTLTHIGCLDIRKELYANVPFSNDS